MMTKQIIRRLLCASAIALTAGCATVVPVGSFFTSVTVPVAATSNGMGPKKGVSSCTSILALVATGDCSLQAAKNNGGITEVTHVDWKSNNILGIIGNYELVVYGK